MGQTIADIMSDDAPTDDQLVALAQEGDARAFEGLYRRHERRVYALCLRMTGRRDQAEDCAQEAFVQAWRRIGSFQGRSAFGTWLHRVAVNQVLSHQRKESRRPRHLEPVSDNPDPYGAAPGETDPGKSMDLEQAIRSLPQGARNIVVLHVIHGYSHDEAASMLGIATGTCKAQLHRARRLLGERLGK